MAKAPQVAVKLSAVDDYTATMKQFGKHLADIRRQVNSFDGGTGGGSKIAETMLGGTLDRLEKARAASVAMARSVPGLSALTGLGTAAGIGVAVRDFSQLGVTLEQTSKQAGMSVAGLNSMRGAARLAGMDASVAEGNMVGLKRAVEGAIYGKDPRAAQMFNAFKIGIGNARDGARDMEGIVRDVSDAIASIYRANPSAGITLGGMWGLDERGVALLARGADKLKQLRDATPTFTPEQQRAADAYAGSIGRVSNNLENLRNVMVTRLEPSISPMMQGFTAMTEKLTETKTGTDALAVSMAALAGNSLLRLLLGVNPLKAALGAAASGPGLAVVAPAALAGDTNAGATPDGFLPGFKPNNDDSASMGSRFSRWFHGLFSPAGGGGGGPANPAAGLPVNRQAAAKASYEFWRSKGYTAEGAASMAAMEMGESGGDVAARNGSTHGLYQHDPARRAAILNSTGINISTETNADRQREGTYQEAVRGLDVGANRAYRVMSTTRSLSEGVSSGVDDFERSADRAGDKRKRLAIAQDILRLYGPDSPGSRNAAPETPDTTRGGRVSEGAEVPDLTRGGRINVNQVPLAGATTAPSPATVRLDINHNAPPGSSVAFRSDSDWVNLGDVSLKDEMSKMNINRAMPERDYSRGY